MGADMVESKGVSQLGYIILNVSEIEAWRDLTATAIGCEHRHDARSEQVQLRFDDYHHRISLRPATATTDSVAAIGWEVPSLSEFESVRRKVSGYGLPVTEGSPEDLAERKVKALLRFRDMDGFPLEIYYGPWIDDVPFLPSRPMSGFNCRPLGLGHVVMVTKDRGMAARFYQEVLGFSVTDYIAWDEAVWRLNHHSTTKLWGHEYMG
jgi:catechol 2,3-dioxygenase-like lactoylglutathione lyase family enzyme